MSTQQNKIGEFVVKAVNEKTGLKLTYSRMSPQGGAVIAHDENLRQHVLPFYGSMDNGWMVRSVIVAHRRNGPIAWMINGQATKGKELFYWAEGDCTAYADLAFVHDTWRSVYGDNWEARRADLHASGQNFIMKLPHYLEVAAV